MFKQKSALGIFFVLFFLVGCFGPDFPVFASYKESAEPEVIVPKPGIASTDFEIEYKEKKEEPPSVSFFDFLTPPEEKTEEKTNYKNRDLREKLIWQQYNYPDFSIMAKIMALSSQKLLPQELGENLTIRGGENLSGQAKHHVFGRHEIETEEGPPVMIEDPAPPETPTEQVTVPTEWPQIIGQSKILGGLLGAFEAPKSVIIDIVNPVNTNAPPRKTGHTKSQITVDSSPANTYPEKEGSEEKNSFATKALLTENTKTTTKAIQDFFEQVLGWFKKETKETLATSQDRKGGLTLANKTRATVPGLETINEQSSLFAAFLPADLVKDKDGKVSAPLAVKAQYEVSEKYSLKEGSDETVFQNLGKTVKNYCLALCSQYPADYPIIRIDPLCTSCDPGDYEMTGYGDVLLNKEGLCQFEEGVGCHYYEPSDNASQGCGPGKDPVCEGKDEKDKFKCNPYEIGLDGDYDACGGPPHGSCVDSSVCYVMTFAPNPAGGYGECQYANSNVCVRADRIQVGECAAVCNWGCCAWQKY